MADPALRSLNRTIRDLANPFAAWLSEAMPEIGAYDPLPEIVAEAEAEGSALIGAKPCPAPHGVDRWFDGSIADEFLLDVFPCDECGAAL